MSLSFLGAKLYNKTMIATLSGEVAEKLAEKVVINVNGVGYGLLVAVEDFGQLKVGQKVKLYVYEQIREDSHELFGFVNLETKYLFEQLLSVNGVGPKMALNMLSIGSVSEVRGAIASGDVKFMQVANGVGRKLAERLIIELKDKIGVMSTADTASLLTSSHSAQKDEAVQALVALGFNAPDAVTALGNVDSDLPAEQRVKLALRSRS